jgi:non-canonical poly(A) RNA polymerase PAPD5/7
MAYSDKVTVLHALANTLKRAGITSRVTIIAKAKVPIVKFVTTHGRFNVDISINQSNGILSGNIINGFLQNMHPNNHGGGRGSLALRSLIMITKAFLSQRSMNEVYTGGLGSYSIVCLAISFLQMHPKIRRGEIDAEKNLGVLVIEFFELYGCYFNYEEAGISVRDGGAYFNKKQRGWYDHYKSNLLSIEDPADSCKLPYFRVLHLFMVVLIRCYLANDISRGSYAFQKVRTTFAGAYGILTSTAYLHAGILSARREGRTVHLRSRGQPEEMSVLSSVMGITQQVSNLDLICNNVLMMYLLKTVNHRKLVQELYDKRVLHNLLGLKPSPTIVSGADSGTNGTASRRLSSPGPSQAAKRTQSAWHRAEVGVKSDDDEYLPPRRRHAAEDHDEGRYDMRPQKLRKIERPQANFHTVFTTDDDEYERSSVRVESVDSLDEEEGHYASDDELNSDQGRAKKRRSFWLSKAMNIGIDMDSYM